MATDDSDLQHGNSDTTPPDWHALPGEDVFERLASASQGLDKTEAEQRLKQIGPNRLRAQQSESALRRLLRQFNNVLIYVLLAAGFITLLLGHWIDSGVIFGVVIINALIGFVQEGKAQKALAAIQQLLTRQARVRREGQVKTLDAEQLVPGDVVLLQSGDKVPADLRLFKSRQLRIDESLLTGESVAAEKTSEPDKAESLLADRHSMAYSGTLVTYGQGTGVVVATGNESEVGRISDMLQSVVTLTTPLLQKIAQFSRWLTGAILVIASATLAYGIFIKDYTSGEMFLAAVSLAVAAIPEGLPAIMTITLAIGVQRMARRNAIIRRLPAVETLGSVTVICSDKTGTLTQNVMIARNVVTAKQNYEISGNGYEPYGDFSVDRNSIEVESDPVLSELTRAALLCNDAKVEKVEGQWQLHGDPTEGALVVMGMKAGLDPLYQNEQWPRGDAIPFESEHRFMATLHHDHAGHGFIYVKGAPEQILSMCSRQRTDGETSPLDTPYWHEQMHQLAENGQRVLAIAFNTTDSDQRELNFNDVEAGLTLLGMVGIMDPPRDEAIESIRQCYAAGIRIKMITGDHATTALAIARKMGIVAGDSKALTGADLDQSDDAALQKIVRETDIFARVSPEQKLRLVEALQTQNNVVAMTGDGVNDAPALKRADVGVAMGKKGTEVAREAAEMVLADDNFASIARAIEEGRIVYDNLKKSIMFILPTNGAQALTLVVAILLGMMLPITPVQILWINMVTAVTLALSLAFEPAEGQVMARPPRDPEEPIFTPFLIWRILFVSLILAVGTFGLFFWERGQGTGLDEARTMAVNVLVLFEMFYLLNSRFLIENSLTWRVFMNNRYVLYAIGLLILLQLAFTYWGPLQLLFSTTALALTDWARLILIAASVFFIVELEKWIIRRWIKTGTLR
ncbi:cation-transporting P-type ATPase [Thiohalophilus thiocyanatoxydans]|uniref:Calcium-translocating P-type ATPase/potassium/sodium efflux P-type ATPase,TIGR01523 n=1 Tax=Thiohalophilus thiocyanatoxydans TaxID=381308 RepID=A0A4V3H4D6_9GAMM|nr:cation-transporting P-type ATPase [Thiohalophilus thiocyanatoxydans]TDY02815.1 calcium-translocating P-type ATPase/potassium/sodium efflux P-type ATPase,TIGR01523 [Thiohalophilus thiocyanatoxydans]